MIRIDQLRKFPFKTKRIRIPEVSSKEKYSIIFFPENSNLFSAYNNLGILRQDARNVNVQGSRRPRLIINAKIVIPYRKLLKLMPRMKVNKLNKNFYVDVSPFLNVLEKQFSPQQYRAGLPYTSLLKYMTQIDEVTKDTKRIFMYYVDLDNDLQPSIFKRKIFPLLLNYRKTDRFMFDYFILALKKKGKLIYTAFITDNDAVTFNRMYMFLKNIQSGKTDEDTFIEADNAAIEVVDGIDVNPEESTDPSQPPPESEEKQREVIRQSVRKYVEAKPKLKDIIKTGRLNKKQKSEIASKSIIYNLTGSTRTANKEINPIKDKELALRQTRKDLIRDIVASNPPVNVSREIINASVNIPAINNYKDPSRILNKRSQDFENSFEKDLRSTFSLLAKKKDFPLKIESVRGENIPVDPGDLDPTIERKYTIILKDERNRKHPVEIKIPLLLEDSTFMINGKKKYLMYQIILDPILFLKKWLVKLETLYATTSIEFKRLKAKQYLKIYIAGQDLPLMLLMGYYLGFNEVCKKFNIKYKLQEEKPEKDVFSLQMKGGGYIIPEYTTEHAKYLLMSFNEIDYPFTINNILEKNTFEKAIVRQTRNLNSPYSIGEVLKNIMEPVAVQVLKSKMLPFTFEDCVLYMCKNVVDGRVDKRNDLTNQRLRSSEVFNHQILKQVLKSYNTYRLQKVSGDKAAEYKCDTDRVIKEITNSKLVRNLENVNPLEELSCLTRTTPIGPGGVANKVAITEPARGTHESYYGNLDPMDTPEGDTIGVINQLAIGAAITNARGSFISDISIDKGVDVLGTSSILTPFVNSDDGNRVQFCCSQSRQAVSIMENEPPLCQTGYETILTNMLSDSYIKKAKSNGEIVNITENIIVVKGDNGRLYKESLKPQLLNSAQGQDAISPFKIVVKKGQRVKQGEILAEGKHIINGTISTGTNLLVAIMGWKGYVFEDGYVISDRLVNKKLASNHYFEQTIIVKKGDKIRYIAEEGKDTLKGEPLLIRTSTEIEELIGLKEDEIEGGEIKTKSKGGKILSIEIYPNISLRTFPVLQEPFIRFKNKYEEQHGEFPKKFTKKVGFEKLAPSGVIIVFKLEDHYPAELGDKLANRHGNKGVITYIEKEENMPRTPWGEKVDIIYNPLSIVNRMNPGQLYEMYISTISKFAAKQLVEWGPNKTKKAINYIVKIYKGLDNTKGKKYSSDISRLFNSMSDLKYGRFIKEVEDRNYFLPIIVPQFKTPTRKQIQNVMKFVGVKSSYNLSLPEHGNKKTLRKVAVGYMYFNKLEQQASIKMSARSTAMYQSKTLQPTAGKKRDGGQRAGEADVNMILSHGAVHVLKEFLGPLSDDQATKNEIISEIIQNGNAPYREPKTSPTRNLLSIYMTSLGLSE